MPKYPKEIRETCFEFVDTDDIATFYSSDRKYVNIIRKLKKKYPDDVDIRADNDDGSICAHVPKSWMRVRPPKKVSEQQRARMREIGKQLQEKKREAI